MKYADSEEKVIWKCTVPLLTTAACTEKNVVRFQKYFKKCYYSSFQSQYAWYAFSQIQGRLYYS